MIFEKAAKFKISGSDLYALIRKRCCVWVTANHRSNFGWAARARQRPMPPANDDDLRLTWFAETLKTRLRNGSMLHETLPCGNKDFDVSANRILKSALYAVIDMGSEHARRIASDVLHTHEFCSVSGLHVDDVAQAGKALRLNPPEPCCLEDRTVLLLAALAIVASNQ